MLSMKNKDPFQLFPNNYIVIECADGSMHQNEIAAKMWCKEYKTTIIKEHTKEGKTNSSKKINNNNHEQ